MGLLDKVPFLKKKEDPFDSPDSGLSDDPFKTDIGEDPLKSPDPLSGPSPYDNPNLDSMQQTQNNINDQMHESLMPPSEAPQNLPGKPAHQQPQTNNNGGSNNPINNNGSNISDHKIELILSKLDTIKLNIENINLRLNKIENEIQEQKKSKHSW